MVSVYGSVAKNVDLLYFLKKKYFLKENSLDHENLSKGRVTKWCLIYFI